MIFKPTCKQGIKWQKYRICTVENMYFVKQALPRLSWYVTHLSRFSNTFRIYNSMQCWILYKDFESKGQKCPVLQDERWVHDWNFPSACTWENEIRPFPRIGCLACDQIHAGTNREILDQLAYLSWLSIWSFVCLVFLYKNYFNFCDVPGCSGMFHGFLDGRLKVILIHGTSAGF